MGNFNNVSMGTGTLKINDVDVGFLKGNVNYRYNYDIAEFKTGVPRTLRGSITKEVTAELTAPLAEITAENIAMILGGLTPAETAAAEVDKTATWETLTFADAPWSPGMQYIKLGPAANRGLWVAISTGVGGADKPDIGSNVAEPVLYTENDDYIVDYDTGIVYRNPAGTIAESAAVKCKYKYTPPASKQINLGAQFSLADLKIEFTHTSPVTGKDITVLMWKANASGNAELGFDEENYIVNNVTFKAVFDSSHAINPLGYINFEV